MLNDVILWIFLTINAVTDIRKRTIYLPVIFLFGAGNMLLFICDRNRDIVSAAGGVMTGVYLLMFSICSRGAIGFGDGLVVAVTGIQLGGWKTVFVLMGGFLLAAFFGVAGLCMKKINGKSELPFIPFYAVSYLILYIGGCL